MKILHTVQRYEPDKGGSEEVVRQLSERLAARGHEVTVATGSSPKRNFSELHGVRIEEFEVRGNEALGIRGETERYRSFIKSYRADVMLNYAAQIWSTDLALDLLPDLDLRKVMVPCGYSGLHSPEYREYFQSLPTRLAHYDALVYMSPNYQDRKFGLDNGLGDREVIIPNGAAAEEFEAAGSSFKARYEVDTPRMVLTVANHHTSKGHAEVIKAFKSLKRSDATLVIIGEPASSRPWVGCYWRCLAAAAANSKIKILSGVPRDAVVSAYKEADVFVLASTVECSPLVIYEAMAAGTPFISFDCGDVRDHSESGIVIDDPAQLATSLSAILDDPSRRAKLGHHGRREWGSAHTWEQIAEMYEGLYMRLVS